MQSKLMIWTKVVMLVLPIIVIAFLYSSDYRFRSTEAVDAALNLREKSMMFGKEERLWGKVYLLQTENGFKTALAVKRFSVWKCPTYTSLSDDTIKNDSVKTVGWISFKESNNKQITVLAVKSEDKGVKYIEAGVGSDIQKKPINSNEVVIFSWDKVIGANDISAIAYDKNDKKLYKCEYDSEKIGEEFRWNSIKNK